MFSSMYLTHLMLFFAFVYGVPVQDESKSDATPATSDAYEQRTKLLTGGNTIPTCYQNNDDLNNCLKRIFSDMLPRLTNGIPELNIPPIEPFHLNRTSFRFSFGPAKGRLTMRNGMLYGTSSAMLKNIDFKVKNGATKMTVNTFTPWSRIVGDYKADVILNNQLHFKPRGTFNVSLSNIDTIMKTDGEFYEKDGHKFIRITKFDAVPKIGDLDFDVTGVFEDPELNNFALNLGKQYWREIYSVMLPETRSYWAPMVVQLLNDALSLVPYDLFVKNK